MTHKSTVGKLKLNLVPNHGLAAVARVREFGCNKYPSPTGDEYLTEVKVADLIEACKRHLLQASQDELLDPESLEMHLAHVATSAMMAMEIIYTKYKTLRKAQEIKMLDL